MIKLGVAKLSHDIISYSEAVKCKLKREIHGEMLG